MFSFIITYKKNQLHAVSRTQHGRQRGPSHKTNHSPFWAKFWSYFVLKKNVVHWIKSRSNKHFLIIFYFNISTGTKNNSQNLCSLLMYSTKSKNVNKNRNTVLIYQNDGHSSKEERHASRSVTWRNCCVKWPLRDYHLYLHTSLIYKE